SNLKLQKVDVDLYSLVNDKKALLASENTPKRYRLTEYVATKYAPKIQSTAFETPYIDDVEIVEDNGKITLKFDAKEIYDYIISNSVNDETQVISGSGDAIAISIFPPDFEEYNFVVTPISKFDKSIIGEPVATKTLYKKYSLSP
ncbi:MAG: hypothetical protein RR107_03555, partial [Clostridia bacterium]